MGKSLLLPTRRVASAQGRTMLEFALDHEGAEVYRMLAEVIIHDHNGR
jgi:hypothetical protein